ncbi:DUF3667 domain-containing protein [Massilia sp. YIM B02443]|uniref:DUF3667 domain-containing protein n=1 Tax=Massilia sp. YIM B02443 TaxID=3050127 RepID=UPI0025B62F95|nr:DUF3667 domain-containing protein [Massilia sp. YIM B02443]
MPPVLDIVPPDLAAHAPQTGAPHPHGCPSCHFPAQGNFCSHCGESTHPHPPSAGEFLHEFVGHYVALEGKLWRTLRTLLLAPGRLTADHLRGVRVPFVNPLRLYLTLSLIVFALIKIIGVDLPQVFFKEDSYGLIYEHKTSDPATGKPRNVALYVTVAEAESDKSETDSEKFEPLKDAVAHLGRVNKKWASNLQQFVAAPKEQQAALLNQGFLSTVPYMLIGALPLFALYLKLIYWRTRRLYGEHLVFALHYSAFVFLLASAMMLIPGNVAWLIAAIYARLSSLAEPWDWLQLLPVCWIVAYLAIALRRVYGGSRPAAWVAALVLLGVHMTAILALIAGAEFMAVLRHG